MKLLKKKSHRILAIAISFLILSIVSFCLMVISLKTISRPLSLSISYLEGDLYFSSNGEVWEIADESILITQGHRIRTGKDSRTELQTPSGSFIRLNENSELKVGQISHRDALFTQLSGRGYYRVKPSRNNTHQIRSLNHTIKSTSGAFDLSVNLKANRINVKAIDKEVELSTDEGFQSIASGKEITVSTDLSEADINNDYLSSDWFQWNKEMDEKYGFSVSLEKTSSDEATEGEASEDSQTEAASPSTPKTPSVTTPPISNHDSCKPYLSAKKDTVFKGIKLNWTTCPSEDFQFYKIIRSTLNSYPNYPDNPAISSSSNKHYSNYIDQNVIRSRTYYYRACVVERLNSVSCGNVVSMVY